MPTSQNGWPANDVSRTSVELIPGTDRKIRLVKGDGGWLLRRLAAWFDKHIESVDGGVYDDWGYAERPIRGSSTTLSNHASGTAIDLNATRHPLGVRNTFSNAQEDAIRAHLREYGGVIRWGGDYANRADEMHFEINRDQEATAAVARKLRTSPAEPPSTTNVTISTKAMVLAAQGHVFNVTDQFYADARQFLAWGRAIGAVDKGVENNWVHYHSYEPVDGYSETGGRVFRQAVRQVQAHFHLAQDGIAGPLTLAEMKPYGYVPVDYAGNRL
jgi:hypothetical protein